MNRKDANNQQPSDPIGWIEDICVPPLEVEARGAIPTAAGDPKPDALLLVRWDGQECLFACARKSRNTPKTIETAIAEASRYSRLLRLRPLIVVPYLSEENLQRLDREQVSGLDQCGNGLVLTPDFRIYRSGQPNRFRDSAPIRNIYRGASSLVVRSLLMEGAFESLTALRDYTAERIPSGKLSLGTVSKVAKALEEDRLLIRNEEGIRLADRRGALEKLLSNARSKRAVTLQGRTEMGLEEVGARLGAASQGGDIGPYTVTGLSSAGWYGVLSAAGPMSVYVGDVAAARELLEVRETRVFPTIELVEDRSDVVPFDRRVDGTLAWASPVQTWIELMKAGPREREAAAALESSLGWSGDELP